MLRLSRRSGEWSSLPPIDGFVASIRALQDFDLNPYLKGVDAPALLVVGELDAALVPTMKTMADEIPHAQMQAMCQWLMDWQS
jgi:pimeloyl-ACP methyl ester carboxylesterase